MKELFVIILNHNQAADTIVSIESVEKQRVDGVRVKTLIIDNGSTDSSLRKIKGLKKGFSNLTVLENYRNLGFAEGVNRGIEYALKKEADYIFLLNNDALLGSRALAKLVDRARKRKKAGIIGPKIYYYQSKIKRIWFAGGKIDRRRFTAGHIGYQEEDIGRYDKETETDYVTGAAMLIKRSVFEKIGLFDPSYFLYYEDVDFCLRANAEGFRLIYYPKAVVYHKISVFHKDPFYCYYMTRNHFLFLEKHAPLFIKIREILRLPITLLEIAAEKPEIKKFRIYGLMDYFKRQFGKCERLV